MSYAIGDHLEFRYMQGSRRGEVRRFKVEKVTVNGYEGFDFTVGQVRKYLARHMRDVIRLHRQGLTRTAVLQMINSQPLDVIAKGLRAMFPDDHFEKSSITIVRHYKVPATMVDNWYVTVNGTSIYFEQYSDGSIRLERPYEGNDHRIKKIIADTVKSA